MRHRIADAVLPGLIALAVAATSARAEHDHGATTGDDDHAPSSFGAGVTLLAARFATAMYAGDYEAVVPNASWVGGRLALGAALPLYHLVENGNSLDGLGDATGYARATVVGGAAAQAGVALAVALPTGHEMTFGMGHVMVMPSVWGAWHRDRVGLAASVGAGRALDHAGHVHGAAPMVDPMNLSELTWSAGADLAIASGVRAGARLGGAVPIDLPGVDRVVGALRASWGARHLDTAAELQLGLVGDPFTIRGVVQTSVRF